MLARNSDLEEATEALTSFESQFNHRYNYPVVFLNNEPWTDAFKQGVSAIVSGQVIFDTISPDMWGYPDHVDQEAARAHIKDQADRGIIHAGQESYHHMCRFYSMKFYDHPAMQPYKWYWRLEPGVSFECPINFDPFTYMVRENKRYAYAIALQEVGSTVRSLYRTVSDYKNSMNITPSRYWNALISLSWAPLPIRWLLRLAPYRDSNGDEWNLCHFWNNFEIADLDFFRREDYRHMMDHLDKLGGFYTERWGDASVRSFAATLLLKPEEIHYFGDDMCYCHGKFCSPGINLLDEKTSCPVEWPVEDIEKKGTFNEMCHARFRQANLI
ncbi:nucleotide-diphospho-sugar transferase [Aureobasidium sp. EXF-8845]|nr:nucleotide-diphospho-sugar transferase [Aureobasidium sp. EXF-8845]KAI4843649.1 nucleotide-diphospho-sugar transferase [Aureobasidium sp. EXF-8846]